MLKEVYNQADNEARQHERKAEATIDNKKDP